MQLKNAMPIKKILNKFNNNMKLDPTLIRSILFDVEQTPPAQITHGFNYDDIDQATVDEHTHLLIENNYLDRESICEPEGFPVEFAICRITMKGHEFIANARNDTVWKKVISEFKSKGISGGMTVLNSLLLKVAEEYAGL